MLADQDGEAPDFIVEGYFFSLIGAQTRHAIRKLMLDTGPVLYVVFILGEKEAPSCQPTGYIPYVQQPT